MGTRDSDYDALASALDKVLDIAASRDLKAHYHPHLSTIVENPEEVRKIFAKTAIGFCPERRIWRLPAAMWPTMVREHASRISYVHLKGLAEGTVRIRSGRHGRLRQRRGDPGAEGHRLCRMDLQRTRRLVRSGRRGSGKSRLCRSGDGESLNWAE